jgi:gluconolactonase
MRQTLFLLTVLVAGLANQTTLGQEQKQPTKKDDAKAIIGTVERLDPRFDQLIPKDAQLEKIAEGFIWTEGAAWYKPGKWLLFSDIPNNVVIKWEPGKGTSEYLKPSGYTGVKPRGGKAGDEPGSNGLFVDSQGRLYLCEHGDRRVTRIEKDGKKTVLADNYMGKRLNSPNDLALHPNGDVYFTDPPYGLAKGDTRELDFSGVFRISGKDGKITLVSKTLNPNGIALSPDLLCDQWRLLDGFPRQRGRLHRRGQSIREHQAVETHFRKGRRPGRHEVRCAREPLRDGTRRCLRHRSRRHPPGPLSYRRPNR